MLEFKNMCKLTPALPVIANLIQIRMTVLVFVWMAGGNIWTQLQFSSDINTFLKLWMIVKIYSNLTHIILQDTQAACNIRTPMIIYRLNNWTICRRQQKTAPASGAKVEASFGVLCLKNWLNWVEIWTILTQFPQLACSLLIRGTLLWYCGIACGHAAPISHISSPFNVKYQACCAEMRET